MKLFHTCAALLLAALTACATVEPEPASPSYYVMRHLQKAEGPDPGLTEEGRRNADTLATLIADAPPRAVYASTTRRARETAEPVARRFGVPVREYDPADRPGLIARVKAEKGPVLIVGHSNTVPAIVEALGGSPIGEIGEKDYGTLFTLRRGSSFVHRQRVHWGCDPLLGGEDSGARC
jgi:phosphohistidine phosphatase SixA